MSLAVVKRTVSAAKRWATFFRLPRIGAISLLVARVVIYTRIMQRLGWDTVRLGCVVVGLFVAAAGCAPTAAHSDSELTNQTRQALIDRSRPTQTWLAASDFKTSLNWFDTTSRDRIWLADVSRSGGVFDGDDVVGIDFGGNVLVSKSTGTGFTPATTWLANSVFKTTASDSTNYFTDTYRQHVWVQDVTGDRIADIVGIANDGTIKLYVGTGTGFGPASSFASPFAPLLGWFDPPGSANNNPSVRVWLADVTGDTIPDFVGIGNGGDIWVCPATGTGFGAAVGPTASNFSNSNGWFSDTYRDRLWVADVTGDLKADIVGIAFDGTIGVSAATGGGAFAATAWKGSTVFTSDQHWFDTSSQPRIWVTDVSGDHVADIVGIAPAGQGNGDIWVSRSTLTGFSSKVWLHDSKFKSGVPSDDWFSTLSRPRVWLSDVTGDDRADVVGVASNGEVWSASAVEYPSNTGVSQPDPSQQEGLFAFLPSLRTAKSQLKDPTSTSGYFTLSKKQRVWFARVTNELHVNDIVAIAPAFAPQQDGDITWTQVLPTSVTAIAPVTNPSGAQTVKVSFSRGVSCNTLGAASGLTVKEKIGTGSEVTLTAAAGSSPSAPSTYCSFNVTFTAPGSSDVKVSKSVDGLAWRDRWGQPLDGNGNGFLDGFADTDKDVGLRIDYWYSGLVGGAGKLSLGVSSAILASRPLPFPAAGSTDASCYLSNVTPTNPPNVPPPMARFVILGRGGSTAVIVSAELLGINPGRLRSLIAARTGIDEPNIIVAATHSHVVLRTLRPYVAPSYDDRTFEGSPPVDYDYPSVATGGVYPYVQWIEDSIARQVASSYANLVPVKLGAGTGTYPSNADVYPADGKADVYDRWFSSAATAACPGPIDYFDGTLGVISMIGTDNHRIALIANYGMHPVIIKEDFGITSDFPGFMSECLETSGCAASGVGYDVGMFVQAGGGDVDPKPEWDSSAGEANGGGSGMTNAVTDSRGHGVALAQAAHAVAASGTFAVATTGWNVTAYRTVLSIPGISSCDNTVNCASNETRPDGAAVKWDVESTALKVGIPGNTALAVATVPGEAFSHQQHDLRFGSSVGLAKTFLFGYANGYMGYFPDRQALDCVDTLHATDSPRDCRYAMGSACVLTSPPSSTLFTPAPPVGRLPSGFACYSTAYCSAGGLVFGTGPVYMTRGNNGLQSAGDEIVAASTKAVNYLHSSF